MDDLISRQAAIEVADAVWMVTGDNNVAKVWAQLKDIPSAQQWIPCSERLPEEYVNVLCYQAIYYGNNIWIGYLNADGIWVDSDGWEKLTNPATAWMPLPEPFKDNYED